MNTKLDRSTTEELRRTLVDSLRAIPWLSVSTHGGLLRWGLCRLEGFFVELESEGRRFCLVVETRAQFEPRQFRELAAKLAAPEETHLVKVLGLPHVTPRMAELCQEAGWGWFDLAGNCRLDLPGLLFIERVGAKPPRPTRAKTIKLDSPEASRVVRALLAPQNAGKRWTQREVVHHFLELPGNIPSPSLALVNKVVRYLSDQAVVAASTRGFEVCDPDGLLKLWCQSYDFQRQERHRWFTLLREDKLMRQIRKLGATHGPQLALGVFSAANLQAPHVRQPRTWLYVAPGIEEELVTVLEAKPVASGDNLVLLSPDDPGIFYGLDWMEQLPCTNPVQTYVDLYHAGGRGQEAAEALRTQSLLSGWINYMHNR